MSETQSCPAVGWQAAEKVGRRFYCTDCYLILPPETRKGRGARKIGWLSGSEIREKCCKCGCTCFRFEDECERESG